MFDSKNDVSGLLKQAKKMQEKIKKIQEEIKKIEVVGVSGAGLVEVTVNGAHNCLRVTINSNLLKDDKEILEDLIAAAFNDAARRIEERKREKIASVSEGIELPYGFNIHP